MSATFDPVRAPAGPSAAVHHANQIPSRAPTSPSRSDLDIRQARSLGDAPAMPETLLFWRARREPNALHQPS